MVFGPLMWSVWKRTGTPAYRSPGCKDRQVGQVARQPQHRVSRPVLRGPSSCHRLVSMMTGARAWRAASRQSVTAAWLSALTARTA